MKANQFLLHNLKVFKTSVFCTLVKKLEDQIIKNQ